MDEMIFAVLHVLFANQGAPLSVKSRVTYININELLVGAQPRLIDEWQDVPKFWDAVRFSVDHEEGFGHYILTGSAAEF